MWNPSALTLLVIANATWCVASETHAKRVNAKHQIPVSDRLTAIKKAASDVTIKFRDLAGQVHLDADAHLTIAENGKAFLQSDVLARVLQKADREQQFLFLLFEQMEDVLRVTGCFKDAQSFQRIDEERPELRLAVFGIPPSTVMEVQPTYSRDGMDADGLFENLLARVQKEDPALFSVHTESFLRAPHIVVPLLSHLASLSAEDNLKFPVQLKRLSDQFRSMLEMEESPLRIHKVELDHLSAWSEAQGNRYAYLDGGVAKVAGLPGAEPTALRVGIYCVRAGDMSLETREGWHLQPFVVGDIIDKKTGVKMDEDDQMDLRRLGEAARYVLEPLTGLRFVGVNKDVTALFMQGPLINQFVMYDEGEPNFIPFLKEEFLSRVDITQTEIERFVKEIPSRDGKKMWRQFMAVYGYIAATIHENDTPFLGVVERSAGRWLAGAVLDGAVAAKIVKVGYKNKVMDLLKRYSISDDFLFGCVLAEGEYVTPVEIPKNDTRRARDHWRAVVAGYPRPFATIIKTTEYSFPFRVEMNRAAKAADEQILKMLYHTARLLPRYAFPAGLDIVDKYAKVPQWLSRNISARLAASVLNRAMAEGDARLVAQVRQLLAHTPRDFFYRPTT